MSLKEPLELLLWWLWLPACGRSLPPSSVLPPFELSFPSGEDRLSVAEVSVGRLEGIRGELEIVLKSV